jgi:hypothetical protein
MVMTEVAPLQLELTHAVPMQICGNVEVPLDQHEEL